MKLDRGPDGWTVAGSWYRLSGTDDGLIAILTDALGERWAEIRLLASVDTVDGADETLAHSSAAGLGGMPWRLKTVPRVTVTSVPTGNAALSTAIRVSSACSSAADTERPNKWL